MSNVSLFYNIIFIFIRSVRKVILLYFEGYLIRFYSQTLQCQDKTSASLSHKMIAKWIFFLISFGLTGSHFPNSIPPIFATFTEKIASGDISALQVEVKPLFWPLQGIMQILLNFLFAMEGLSRQFFKFIH